MTRRQLYIFLLLLGSSRGRGAAVRSLKRRWSELPGSRHLSSIFQLRDEDTDYAMLRRHHESPDERNVFVFQATNRPTASPGDGTDAPTVAPAPVVTPAPAPITPTTITGAPSQDPSIQPTRDLGDGTDVPTSATSPPPTTNDASGAPTLSPGDGTDQPTTNGATVAPTGSAVPSPQPSSFGSSVVSLAPSNSDQTTESPSTSSAPSSLGDLTLETFLFQSLTDDGSLTTAGTPQNQALVALSESNPDLDPNIALNQVEIVQRYALNTLYFSTSGSEWIVNSLWTSASPICGATPESTWHGVVCSEDGQNVERLVLAGNDLLGRLPSEIRALSSLSKYTLVKNLCRL